MPMPAQHGSWNHDHTFGQDRKKPGEPRTLLVVLLTAATMVLEIAAGIAYGSMALLADGLHMASHATALAIAMFAYVYARRHADDERFSFGTGKVNSLAGFTGAVLLAMFAVIMVWESVAALDRTGFHCLQPGADRRHDRAGREWTLRPDSRPSGRTRSWRASGSIGPRSSCPGLFALPVNDHAHDHDHDHDHHHAHDHNLRSAYLHVLADALTSVLAIVALLAGKFYGLSWLDPAMGVVGALLVARWSIGLVWATSRVLLDRQGPQSRLCGHSLGRGGVG